MTELLIQSTHQTDKTELTKDIIDQLQDRGYQVEEVNTDKPWGAYVRLANADAEHFIDEFFPGLTLAEAQLGIEGAELSPKILIVAPSQRLSWQLHHRRAERWTFLTRGGYYKSETDDQGELIAAQPGEVVQFQQGERHRLVSVDGYTVVAEIWQHVDPANPSNEDDIIRLEDDYVR